jgi:hypothetical protein
VARGIENEIFRVLEIAVRGARRGRLRSGMRPTDLPSRCPFAGWEYRMDME